MNPVNDVNRTVENVLKTYFSRTKTTIHGATAHSITRVNQFLRQNKISKEEINKHESPLKLTAVHIAVLTGEWKSVQALVKAGGSLLEVDHLGNTPAHLAAILGNWTIVEKLRDLAKEIGQDFEPIRNFHLGTVADLRKITLPPTTKASDVVVMMKSASGEIVPMTQEEYQKRTGTLYCDYPQLTPELLTKDWCEPQFTHYSDGMGLWTSYCRNRPKVYLEEQVVPETNTPVGLGMRAGEEISPKTFLFPWGGEGIMLNILSTERSDFGNERVECWVKSNVACRMNDGFPKVFAETVRVEGAYCGLGVITFDKIAKDEIITYNYGLHHCKFGRYSFFHLKEMEKYCGERDFKAEWTQAAVFMRLRQRQGKSSFSVEELIQVAEISAKGSYILETPRALVYLAARGLLTAEKLENLTKLDKVIRPPRLLPNVILDSFLGNFMQFLKELEKAKLEYRNALLPHVDKLFAEHNVITGLIIFNLWKKFVTPEIFETQPEEFSHKITQMATLAINIDRIVDLAPELLNQEKKEHVANEILSLVRSVSFITDDLCSGVLSRHGRGIGEAFMDVLGIE